MEGFRCPICGTISSYVRVSNTEDYYPDGSIDERRFASFPQCGCDVGFVDLDSWLVLGDEQ